MKILFFGDSLTSAENNNFNGFVEKLELKNYKNYGVSGTTIGNYSLYPVGSTDLLAMISKHEKEIKTADKIFLEYGSNDISSLMVGYIAEPQLYIDYRKCIDYLKQLNNHAEIYFLIFNNNNALLMAKGQYNYLINDYYKDFPNLINFTESDWFCSYYTFTLRILNANFNVNIIEIDYDLTDYISDDGIHPNDVGYQLIADCIKNKVKDLE